MTILSWMFFEDTECGGNQLPLLATESNIKGLRDNCSLVELDLTQSTTNSEALSTLLQPPLVTLILNDCKLDSRPTCVITCGFSYNYNPIGNGGVIALAVMLKKNKTLKKLDLSYCCNISQFTVQFLKYSIQQRN